MTQPIHTPGPVETYNPAAGCKNDGLFWQIRASRKDEVGARKIIASGMAEGDARLLAAAYNAFDSAGQKMGVNAVELAERMQEGGLAELILCLEQMTEFYVDDYSDREASEAVQRVRAVIAKARGAS